MSRELAVNNITVGSLEYFRKIRQTNERFHNIARRIESDLDQGAKNNDYIRDQNAAALKKTVAEFEKSGINRRRINVKIDRLAWFVGGDPGEIRKLQRNLNALGIRGLSSAKLTEDGVYGRNTHSAWGRFLKTLNTGVVPTLAWIDPLQSKSTGIRLGSSKAAKRTSLTNSLMIGKGQPYIRVDIPHEPINRYHLNIDKPKKNSGWKGNRLYDAIQERRKGHIPLSNKTYNAIKDLKKVGRVVRIGGRTLLVAGIALDALELGRAIEADLKDVDKKLGRRTASAAVKIGGRWGGAIGGAKLGAVAGAMTGPAAPIAVPVLSLIGGIGGALGGGNLGRWVVDITGIGK